MAAARDADPEATHPVDLLTAEHRVILGVLEALQLEEGRMAGGGPLRPAFWRDAAAFLEGFADRRHHGKEEDILFPRLAEAGVPERGGPIGVMKLEHEEGRRLVAAIRRAADDGRADDLRAAARDYVRLLREHIDKEDHVLFEMARGVLPPDEAQRVLEHFRRFDAEEGDAAPWLELARRLCGQAGAEAPQRA